MSASRDRRRAGEEHGGEASFIASDVHESRTLITRLFSIFVQVWKTELPVWALLLSIALPSLYTLPAGFIFATSGQAVRVHASFLRGVPGGGKRMS